MFVTVAVLVDSIDRPARARTAFLSAFAFGLGLYLAGVWWIQISLERYGGLAAPLAWLAVLLVCAWLAAGLGLAGLVAHVATRRMPPGFVRLALAAVVWSVLETHVRGRFTLGFPWLTIGNTQVPDGWLAGHVPLVGAQGTSVLVALAAAALVALCRETARIARAAGGPAVPAGRVRAGTGALAAPVAVVTLLVVIGQLQPWGGSTAAKGPPIPVSLLQGNVPQELKWVAQNRAGIVSRYLAMVDRTQGRLVVLPETALPVAWEDVPPGLATRLRSVGAARDGAVLVGVFASGPGGGFQNSVAALGEFPDAIHPKVRLAPFGEFVPLGFLFARIARALDIPHSDLEPGKERSAVELPVGRALVAICYEDTFPGEFSGLAAGTDFLVNVTNGAWFGRSRMLGQHLQISQARALETGREMVRATNTGMTAHIGHDGRVLAALPWHEEGILEVEVVPRTGATPFVRRGLLNLAALVAAILALAWVLRPCRAASRG